MEMSEHDSLRFWSKVEKHGSNCWEWCGHTKTIGYGNFYLDGKSVLAHRVSYCMHIGGDIDGLDIHHTCENKSCVNPDHLEAVSRKQHIALTPASKGYRALAFNVCKSGHVFSPDNTWTSSSGSRQCRECSRQRQRQIYKDSGKKKLGRQTLLESDRLAAASGRT